MAGTRTAERPQQTDELRPGPLSGVRIVEFAGIGPGPFCGMLLADMGADILRIDRKGDSGRTKYEVINRGRRSLALDLKDSSDQKTALELVGFADCLIEGFRPGVMERLELGPKEALAVNPRLVYGRMTGWGQSGPLAMRAGHDINYISISGALHAMGRRSAPPAPPLNLVGDFGGGALYLAMGICAALFEASRSGLGQVIDCAMSDGAISLMAPFYGMHAEGSWTSEREQNLLDGGAHFYDTYECACGGWVSLGAIEPKFYNLFLEKMGLLGNPQFSGQHDRSAWTQASEEMSRAFLQKSRDEWCKLLTDFDTCVAPVLSMAEAPTHPHNEARNSFVKIEGVTQPNVAPRFSRTKSRIGCPPPEIGENGADAVREWREGSAQIV